MDDKMKSLLDALNKHKKTAKLMTGDAIATQHTTLPRGEYKTTIERVEPRISKKGYDYINIMLRLTGNRAFNNSVVWDRIFIDPRYSEKARQFSAIKLESMAQSAGMITEGLTMLDVIPQLEGLSATCVIVPQESTDTTGQKRVEDHVARYTLPQAA